MLSNTWWTDISVGNIQRQTATAVPLGRGQRKERKMFPIQRLTKLPRAGRRTEWSQILAHCLGNWQLGKPISCPCTFLGKVHQSQQCCIMVTQKSVPVRFKLYTWPLHEGIYIEHTQSHRGEDQSLSITQTNLCRITRSYQTTENYNITILIIALSLFCLKSIFHGILCI